MVRAGPRGLCWRMLEEYIALQVDAACKGDRSVDKMLGEGERIYNLQRRFSFAAGFTAADDEPPMRLSRDVAQTGPGKGLTAGIDKILPQYRQLHGWTAGGVPTSDARSQFSL